jgi:hypothetical protein
MDVPMKLASTTLPIGVERCTFASMDGFPEGESALAPPASRHLFLHAVLS